MRRQNWPVRWAQKSPGWALWSNWIFKGRKMLHGFDVFSLLHFDK